MLMPLLVLIVPETKGDLVFASLTFDKYFLKRPTRPDPFLSQIVPDKILVLLAKSFPVPNNPLQSRG